MEESIHFPILLDLGFSLNEAKIYEILLSEGTEKALDLAKKSGLGRANVYAILEQLKARGMVLPIEGKIERFQAVDPARLHELVKQRRMASEALEGRFRTELPMLASAFRLASGKPTVRVFEGVDGFEEALRDSLTSKTEILTYVDVHELHGELRAINDRHVRERIKKNLSKRLLLADLPEHRALFNQLKLSLSTYGFLKNFPASFGIGVEIYDGRVSFLTLKETGPISVIIQEQGIYEYHRMLFEYLWKQADVVSYDPNAPASPPPPSATA